jgi:hypothetical protein
LSSRTVGVIALVAAVVGAIVTGSAAAGSGALSSARRHGPPTDASGRRLNASAPELLPGQRVDRGATEAEVLVPATTEREQPRTSTARTDGSVTHTR